MYNLVANVSSYPDFVPYCSATEILEDNGAEVLASVALNFHGLVKKFTTRNTMQPHDCIKMILVGGPLNKLDKSYVIDLLLLL